MNRQNIGLVEPRDACRSNATNRSVSSKYHTGTTSVSSAGDRRNAWTVLRACTPPGWPRFLNWSVCHTGAYEATFQRLTKGVSLSLVELRLPRNRHVLLFGHSYMKQIADELFCGNRFSVVPNALGDGTGRASYLVWHDPISNTTLTSIANRAALQHSRALTSALPAFLQAQAFDVIFYMPPHADCFFDYQQKRCMGQFAARCIDLSAGDSRAEGTASMHARDAHAWRLMQRHARIGTVLVRGWRSPKKAGRGWPPFWANVPRRKTIDGSSMINAYPCRAPNCTRHAFDHQCRPSAVSLLAREVARVASALDVASSGR